MKSIGSGVVMAFGSNAKGQLGRVSVSAEVVDARAKNSKPKRVKSIECAQYIAAGDYFSIIVTGTSTIIITTTTNHHPPPPTRNTLCFLVFLFATHTTTPLHNIHNTHHTSRNNTDRRGCLCDGDRRT